MSTESNNSLTRTAADAPLLRVHDLQVQFKLKRPSVFTARPVLHKSWNNTGSGWRERVW